MTANIQITLSFGPLEDSKTTFTLKDGKWIADDGVYTSEFEDDLFEYLKKVIANPENYE